MMSLPDQFDSEQIVERNNFSAAGLDHETPALRHGADQSKFVDDRFLIEKVQSTILEYNYLLTSQLEEQRSIFEKKLASTADAYETDQQLREEHERLDLNLEELAEQKRTKLQALAELEDQHTKAASKQKDWQGKIRKVQKDSQAELELLETLKRNHSLLEEDSAKRGEGAMPANKKDKSQGRSRQMQQIEKLRRQL